MCPSKFDILWLHVISSHIGSSANAHKWQEEQTITQDQISRKATSWSPEARRIHVPFQLFSLYFPTPSPQQN